MFNYGNYIVHNRPEIGEIKSHARQLEGKQFRFFEAWGIDDKEMYLGDVAMIPVDDSYPKDAPAWIASGDLVRVTEL